MATITDRSDQIRAALQRITALDPDTLRWHAERYDSGEQFRDMVICAKQGGNGRGQYVGMDNLAAWVANIANACRDDGADTGYVPCLAGEPLAVWIDLLKLYMPGAYALRHYRKEGKA